MEEVKQQPLQGMGSRERDGYKSLFLKTDGLHPSKCVCQWRDTRTYCPNGGCHCGQADKHRQLYRQCIGTSPEQL